MNAEFLLHTVLLQAGEAAKGCSTRSKRLSRRISVVYMHSIWQANPCPHANGPYRHQPIHPAYSRADEVANVLAKVSGEVWHALRLLQRVVVKLLSLRANLQDSRVWVVTGG